MLWNFVPDLPVLAAYILASAVLGITPGPDMTYFLSRTIGQSRTAGFVAFSGASTGIVCHSVFVAAGLSVVLAASVTAFTALKIAGAAYLAWLAIEAIRHGSSLALDRGSRAEPLKAIYLKGLLVNLLNPKIIIFFLTFLPQFVSPSDPHAPGKMLFLGFAFMAINIPVCSALILAADRIASTLKGSARATRLVDWLFAGVLGAFAVKLILTHSR